jgi:hypothetical protein
LNKITYNISQIDPDSLNPTGIINEKDGQLLNEFSVNSIFNYYKDLSSLSIYSLDNSLLEFIPKYNNFQIIGTGGTSGKEGTEEIIIDVVKDINKYGYKNGDVKVVYNFSNDIFTADNTSHEFFIENISPDRTEIRLLSVNLSDSDVENFATPFIQELNNNTTLLDFFVRLQEQVKIKGLNLDILKIEKGSSIIVKLYEPLPQSFLLNDTLSIEKVVADPVAYQIESSVLQQGETILPLRGPNFNVETTDFNNNPTEFFNYNELFSYPISSSNYELYSLFNKKSINIDVDHTDYSDFIHFSSAEERLRNFKYKLDLINSYSSSIETIRSTGYIQPGLSGSTEYYEGLIRGIVQNFDHYDRYLYYESSSYAWPKSNTSRPYLNYVSSHPTASTFFDNQIVIASNYDNTNLDNLEQTVPAFIREDSTNEPYMLFLNMVGQHFDNLWIYFKAISDKYDNDNRLNFGISKDIVRNAIESFGINLYNSNENIQNLLSMFVGETFQTGSEVINDSYSILSGSNLSYLQPVARDNYQKEIYKRIYHNIPLLVKSKGTNRGLRALINCFGIPSSSLEIRQYGGVNRSSTVFTGPLDYFTGSFGKIRTDNTGSIVTGSTLSEYTSIKKYNQKYSDDIHTTQIGFDISDFANNEFKSNLTGSFSIDDYIGDPQTRYDNTYTGLDKLNKVLLEGTGSIYYKDPQAFVRLVKYFDNSLFRIIRDFVPARSDIRTGIVIQPHVLNRSKAKQVQVSFTNEQYSGSIDVVAITGSHGKTFPTDSTTAYTASFRTAVNRYSKIVNTEEPKFTGELSGSIIKASDGELNRINLIKKEGQPPIIRDIVVIQESTSSAPAACGIISLDTEYVGEQYVLYASGSGTGEIEITSPTTVSPTTTITYFNNFDDYEYFVAEASASAGNTFNGWYTDPTAGTLVTGSTTLRVFYETEDVYSTNTFFARFS